jgi:hypothetical protein
MAEGLIDQVEELLRETFEGGRPGEGTQYLDRDSGILATVGTLSAEDASRRRGGRLSIASHLRHMEFHLRVSHEWIAGDHSRRDWKASFLPQEVTPAEWQALVERIQQTRQDFLRVLRGLPPDGLVAEGAGMGAIAHLAYHLGAIRQLRAGG